MLRFLLSVFWLIASFQAELSAQIRLRAEATPPLVGKDQPVQLRYVLENSSSASRFEPPDFSAFVVLAGPMEEARVETVNGRSFRSLVLAYELLPRRTGTFSIKPARIYVGSQAYTSNALLVTVTNSRSDELGEAGVPDGMDGFVLKPGEVPAKKIPSNLYVQATANPKQVFPGQPITLTYKLYTRLKSESNLQRYPPLPGFSVFEHTPENSAFPNVEQVGGKPYHVYVLREVQLYASIPGNQVLPPLQVDNSVYFVDQAVLEQQGPYVEMLLDRFIQGDASITGFYRENLALQSDSIAVTVKPFPAMPDSTVPFLGAVGRFTVRQWLEKRPSGAGYNVMVELAGQGDLPLVNVPEPSWPAGLEVYEPEAIDTLDKWRIPITGSKRLRFPITAAKPGIWVVPPIVFRFFDPATAAYETIQTDSLKLVLTEADVAVGAGNAGIVPQDRSSWSGYLFSHRWLIVLPLVVLVLLAGWWLIRREKRLAPVPAASAEALIPPVLIQREAFAQTRAVLQQPDAALLSWRYFDQELRRQLSELFGVTEASRQALEIQQQQQRVSASVWAPIRALLQEIEYRRFLPGNTEAVTTSQVDAVESHLAHLRSELRKT